MTWKLERNVLMSRSLCWSPSLTVQWPRAEVLSNGDLVRSQYSRPSYYFLYSFQFWLRAWLNPPPPPTPSLLTSNGVSLFCFYNCATKSGKLALLLGVGVGYRHGNIYNSKWNGNMFYLCSISTKQQLQCLKVHEHKLGIYWLGKAGVRSWVLAPYRPHSYQ